MTPKFTFKKARRKTANRGDQRGTVIISVSLRTAGVWNKGNMSRCFSVHEAKVSEVAKAISVQLFGEGDAGEKEAG